MSIRADAEALSSKLIEIRRHVHMYPELGFEEFETAKYIKAKLAGLGLQYKEFAKTGITSEIKGEAGEGKTILIRADIDALPLQEENDVAYKSKNEGIMHACGHDTHVACLLGTAEILAKRRNEFRGKVLLTFQPAEEGPGGAKPMIHEGAIGDVNSPSIDAAIALHVDPHPVRSIGVKDGVFTAGADILRIKIIGAGGHGSAPHKAIDPLYIASLVNVSLQGYLSRLADPMEPLVISIGKIVAGDRQNIISETAYMEGTMRTMNNELRHMLYEKIPIFVKGIAESHGAKAEVEFVEGYDVGINDPNLNEFIREAFSEMYDENLIVTPPAQLGAEDFYEFGLGGRIPAAMFWLGGGNEEKGFVYNNHSNFFDIDEECLPIGSATLAATAIKYLNS